MGKTNRHDFINKGVEVLDPLYYFGNVLSNDMA